MAHIHSRLPRHCAPQRKSPFCFLAQGGREVPRVNRRSAPPLHPPSTKKREINKETGTGHPTPARHPPYSLPASAHKHRLISSTTTTVVIVFSCYFCYLHNWVSLHCCIKDVSNNDLAVNSSTGRTLPFRFFTWIKVPIPQCIHSTLKTCIKKALKEKYHQQDVPKSIKSKTTCRISPVSVVLLGIRLLQMC